MLTSVTQNPSKKLTLLIVILSGVILVITLGFSRYDMWKLPFGTKEVPCEHLPAWDQAQKYFKNMTIQLNKSRTLAQDVYLWS